MSLNVHYRRGFRGFESPETTAPHSLELQGRVVQPNRCPSQSTFALAFLGSPPYRTVNVHGIAGIPFVPANTDP